MIRAVVAVLLAVGAAPLAAQTTAPPAVPPATLAPDYAQESNWICRPGRQDACGRPLPTTDLGPAGYGAPGASSIASDAAVDCFYVYPTVSRDAGLNSDLTPGAGEEIGAATVQFARFAGVCRPFAPLYRSATLASIAAVATGGDPNAPLAFAYGDVLRAWRHYLASENRGRPFVLVGHSQGSIHLLRLLAEEIEGRPEAARMLSALLIGWGVEVPPGRDVGGALRSTPLCRRTGQTGCVVTYMSFRAEAPPPAGSLFGRAFRPGMTAGCTNPAALASGESAPLDSYWFAMTAAAGAAPIVWSGQGPPPTPFLHTPGLVSARCVTEGPVGYLAVTVNADPADARTDRIPGDVILAGRPQPGWGIHPSDVYLAQGDLIRIVQTQSEAFRRARR